MAPRGAEIAMKTRRRATALACLALTTAWLTAAPSAGAAEWPTRTVRIVIAGPPGGAADVVARPLAEGLEAALGRPVIVDYKPGGSGVLAVQELLSAPADGSTFLMIQRGIATEVPQVMKVRYEPYRDLKPLVQLARQGQLLLGNPQLPASSVAELVALAKARPGTLAFGTAGAGLRSHTLGLQFAQLAGIELTFVPYKGAPPALQDLMGGHLPLMVEGPAAVLPMVRAGKARAYATTSPQRTALLPDVPTFAELGYPELTDVSWFALWSRPGLPSALQEQVRTATLQFLGRPETRARLAELGMDPGLPLSSEELSRDVLRAGEENARMLRAIGFRPE
jgi:tripartite-type tricarboxylate transporter receptor subunit TctC